MELKGFGGMSEAEMVQATGKPLRTVQRHLALARAWLETELA